MIIYANRRADRQHNNNMIDSLLERSKAWERGAWERCRKRLLPAQYSFFFARVIIIFVFFFFNVVVARARKLSFGAIID